MNSKCDICLGKEEVQKISSEMPVLLLRHLGVEAIGDLFMCDACNRLLQLWDSFSQRACLNLKSNPFAKKVKEEPISSVSKDSPSSSKSASILRKRTTSNVLVSISQNFEGLCRVCDDAFASEKSLEDHIESEHVNKKFKIYNYMEIMPEVVSKRPKLKCEFCDDTFDDKSILQSHIHEKHPVKSKGAETCEICAETFLLKSALVNHLSTAHTKIRDAKCYCPLCEFKSLYPGNVKSHIRSVHLKMDIVKCKICFARFTGSGIRKHMKSKHGDASFTTEEKLNSNVVKGHQNQSGTPKKVGGDMSSKCKYCLKTFSSVKSQQAHVSKYHPQIDTVSMSKINEAWDPVLNKDSMICPYCFMSFVKQLELHIINSHPYPHLERKRTKNLDFSHEQIQPEIVENSPTKLKQVSIMNYLGPAVKKLDFSCEYCNSAFETRGGLMTHVSKIHLKLFARTCDVCQKVFATPTGMKVHRNSHKIENEVTVEPHKFEDEILIDSQSSESSSETFCCNFCKVIVPTELEFITHLQSHAKEKKFNAKLKDNPDENVSKKVDTPLLESLLTTPEKNVNHTENIVTLTENSETPTEKLNSSLFSCTICNKGFMTRFSLNMHTKKHHEVSPPSHSGPNVDEITTVARYTCDECGKDVLTKHGLVLHKKTHSSPVPSTSQAVPVNSNVSKGKFECKFCKKLLSNDNDFIEHIKAHALGII